MATSPEYDAIIIGAGHNGLAAASVLTKRGLRTLVLEKNNYIGGMAGTREILTGCQNEVGASCLFPLSHEVVEALAFERYGAEFIDLPVMAVNLPGPGAAPLIFYSNTLKQLTHIVRHFGFGAMLGFIRLIAFCKFPASTIDRFTPGRVPKSYATLLAEAPTPKAREQLELSFHGSAMDLIDRFFPDKVKHRTFRALLSFAAIQSTYKGPYTPGSALCLVYTLAQDGSGGFMRRVKGGLGSLAQALRRSIEESGGEVRVKAPVKRILVEDHRAVGVELAKGEQLKARVVLSNLDKPATFFHLLGEQHLTEDFVASIRKIEHKGAYIHMLFKLGALPQYGGEWARLNTDIQTRFGGAIVPDPEKLQASYEACIRGELPEHVPVAFQIPSVVDASLAPAGFHIASAYGFYFPCDAPKEEHGKLRDELAERVIDQLTRYLPDFRKCIVEQAVFSSDHFATMHGATNGDFTHGLIHPEQMVGARTSVDGSAHATPVAGLYLCGSSCHPGPGVTFLPGYNCAQEVLAKEFRTQPPLPA